MDENVSVEANIKNNFLEPNAYLFEEPANLIKQECRDPAQYNSIIKAIATGASKMSEICSKTDIDTALAASYLNKLISLGIVKKEKPFGTDNSRKAIYVLEDSMFRFWYRFIPDNIAGINRRLTDSIFQKIAPQISAFMGGVFEEICKQYLWELNRQSKAAILFTDLGRWWGNDPKKKQECEIDFMGTGDNDTALFAECKWTNEKVDATVLDELVYKSTLFSYDNIHFYLFAKTGFTKGCREQAENIGNVTLVKFEDMFDGGLL
jgi:AAA+ ATPase superfamily predicted ATPase